MVDRQNPTPECGLYCHALPFAANVNVSSTPAQKEKKKTTIHKDFSKKKKNMNSKLPQEVQRFLYRRVREYPNPGLSNGEVIFQQQRKVKG